MEKIHLKFVPGIFYRHKLSINHTHHTSFTGWRNMLKSCSSINSKKSHSFFPLLYQCKGSHLQCIEPIYCSPWLYQTSMKSPAIFFSMSCCTRAEPFIKKLLRTFLIFTTTFLEPSFIFFSSHFGLVDLCPIFADLLHLPWSFLL